MVRTRRGVTATKTMATTGSANSHPRLCPSRARPPSSTAAATSSPRSAGCASRRDARTTQGQNADDQSAAFAFA